MSDKKECVLSIEGIVKEFVLSIEEIVKRKGSTSDDNGSIEVEKISHDEGDIHERLRNLKKLAEAETQQTTTVASNQIAEPPPPPTPPPPKIQKVPFVLRDRNNSDKYYEPRVVSIGPIHHGKPHCRLAAENYKPKLAARFIKESGKEPEALYKIIKDKIHELKDYYHDEVLKTFDDETLSWILFFDGCSVLQFIDGQFKRQLKDFMIKDDHIALAQHDVFLLENQIPFKVLTLLMDSTESSANYKKSIETFIGTNVTAPPEYKSHLIFNVDDLRPIHLLDLLQIVSVLDNNEEKKKSKDVPGKQQARESSRNVEELKAAGNGVKPSKSSSWMDIIFSPCCKTNPGKKHPLQSFRNVQELKAAGIDLKPSKSGSLIDITFSSCWFTGKLHLPPMIVDDSTAPKFLNLIAYEACPDNFRTKYEVTSYISFLDSLIDHAVDVKEMRSEKILHNFLGSDKEVACLFNEIATDLVPNTEIYEDVKMAIQRHYDSRWRTWMAEAFHDHFSSPWTILAFIAALVALALSGIQTWFGIFPLSDPGENCCNTTQR